MPSMRASRGGIWRNSSVSRARNNGSRASGWASSSSIKRGTTGGPASGCGVTIRLMLAQNRPENARRAADFGRLILCGTEPAATAAGRSEAG